MPTPEHDAAVVPSDAGGRDAAVDLPDAWSAGADAWTADPDAAPAADSGTDAGPSTPVCPYAAALQTAIDAQAVRQGASGAAVGIDMPGCLWRGATGVADRATGRVMLENDRFRIASMTKTFTAAVVLLLVDEGVIGLDDRLDAYVVFPRGAAVTIRQLLSHMSGIYDYYNSPPVMADYQRVWTRQEVLDVAQAQPLSFAPGTSYSYSNTNFFLLGMVIESATGQSYEHEVRTRLLEPLHLDDTYVDGLESLPGGFVRGYEHISTGSYIDMTDAFDPSLSWAAGGVISTVEDLDDWARALFTGSVLSAAMRTEMLTPQPLPAGGVAPYGLCIQIQVLPSGLGTFYSHAGRIQGFNTMFGYLLDHDVVTVALANDQDAAASPFMTDSWQVAGLLGP